MFFQLPDSLMPEQAAQLLDSGLHGVSGGRGLFSPKS
jgi:hypothetical protein